MYTVILFVIFKSSLYDVPSVFRDFKGYIIKYSAGEDSFNVYFVNAYFASDACNKVILYFWNLPMYLISSIKIPLGQH